MPSFHDEFLLIITVTQNSLPSYPNRHRRLLRSKNSFWLKTTLTSRVTVADNQNKSRLNKKAALSCQAACPGSTSQEWSIRNNLLMFSINDGAKVSATDGRPSDTTYTTTREIRSLYNITITITITSTLTSTLTFRLNPTYRE